MTTFDERDKAFENKFAHDKEVEFKIQARTSKLVGLWAAEKLGKSAADAENYAKELVQADITGNPSQLAENVQKYFTAANAAIALEEIVAEIVRQTVIARMQVLGGDAV